MDNFKEIQCLISDDKIQSIDNSFYSRLKNRVKVYEGAESVVFKIRKLHIAVGVAAGLLLGLFIGGIVQIHIKEHKRMLLMEDVLDCCCLNEMKYECVEYHVFKDL